MSPKTIFWLLQVGLVFTNASMIVTVVLVGKTMPNYFFFFVIMACVLSMLVYFPVALWRGTFRQHNYNSLVSGLRGWKRAGLVGLGWGINFWFVLWANPNTPPMIQVVLNEMGVGMAMLGSYLLLGKRYTYVHYFSIFFITMGGLVMIVSAQIDVGGTTAIVWDLLYFINTMAIPIAVVITEYFVTLRTTQDADAPFVVDLPWFLGWNSLWTLVWAFVMAVTTYPMSGNSLNKLFDDTRLGFRCFFLQEAQPGDNCGLGAVTIVFASLMSCLSTWLQAIVTRSDGAVFSNMVTALAPAMAAIYFSVPAFMGQYFDESLVMNRSTLISLLIVFGGVAQYKIYSYKNTSESISGRSIMYKIDASLDDRPFSSLVHDEGFISTLPTAYHHLNDAAIHVQVDMDQ